MKGGGALPASWIRVLGQHADLSWSGTVDPGVEGELYGLQVGLDLFGRDPGTGHHDRFGFFAAYAQLDGDVNGQALGWNDLAVSDLDAGSASVAGYWTHVAPRGWYVDGVLMGTWFDGDAIETELDGTALELGGGVLAAVTESIRAFASVDYTTNLGGEDTELFETNIGLNIAF